MYKPGDIVIITFPYKDKGKYFIKQRPVLILEILNLKHKLYKVCQITTKNRSDKLKGHWIKKNSNIGKSMGLNHDSFINLTYTINITQPYIIYKIGKYPDLHNL